MLLVVHELLFILMAICLVLTNDVAKVIAVYFPVSHPTFFL